MDKEFILPRTGKSMKEIGNKIKKREEELFSIQMGKSTSVILRAMSNKDMGSIISIMVIGMKDSERMEKEMAVECCISKT